MLRQWPRLPIHPRTTDAGVTKPEAMFSPAIDQSKPTALILAEKSAP